MGNSFKFSVAIPLLFGLSATMEVQSVFASPGLQISYESVDDPRNSLENWIEDLDVNRQIPALGTHNPVESDAEKRAFLRRPEIEAIPYEQVLILFDQRFPVALESEFADFFDLQSISTRRPVHPSEPEYLDPALLVDLSYDDDELRPTPISIDAAFSGLIHLVQFAEDNGSFGGGLEDHFSYENEDSGWKLNLRYHLKRVLKYLTTHPERVNEALVIMASVGQHCGPGSAYGLELIDQMFFRGDGENQMRKVTLEERIALHLAQLREQVFKQVAAFEGDHQNVHTVNYYRQNLGYILRVSQGFSGDPHDQVAMNILTPGKFIRYFFEGKQGNPKSRDLEERRSFSGYTPTRIAHSVIGLLQSHPEWMPEVKAFLKKGLDARVVRDWAWENRFRILVNLGLWDPKNEENLRSFNALPQTLLETYYIDWEYFTEFRNRSHPSLPNGKAIRELMLRMKHLVPQNLCTDEAE